MGNPFTPSIKLTAWHIPPLTMMVMVMVTVMTEIRLMLASNLKPRNLYKRPNSQIVSQPKWLKLKMSITAE